MQRAVQSFSSRHRRAGLSSTVCNADTAVMRILELSRGRSKKDTLGFNATRDTTRTRTRPPAHWVCIVAVNHVYGEHVYVTILDSKSVQCSAQLADTIRCIQGVHVDVQATSVQKDCVSCGLWAAVTLNCVFQQVESPNTALFQFATPKATKKALQACCAAAV